MTNQQIAAEIAVLREELAKARERIAVLETRPTYAPQPLTLPLPSLPHTSIPWPLTPYATCGEPPRC